MTMIERCCSSCKDTKPIDMFQIDKKQKYGHGYYCKDCFNAKYKQWRERNIDTVRQSKRDMSKKLWKEHPEKMKAIMDKYRKNNPEKVKAVQALNRKVKSGKIVKPSECSVCGSDNNIQGHHSDYSKPFDVDWVCILCHNKIHMKLANSKSILKYKRIKDEH